MTANRQPKGQPTGGQFAASKNPESGVDLSYFSSDDDLDETENCKEIDDFWADKGDEYRSQIQFDSRDTPGLLCDFHQIHQHREHDE